MCPDSESKSMDASSQFLCLSAGESTKHTRPNYILPSSPQMDSVEDMTRNYTQAVLGNIYYQHQEDVCCGLRDQMLRSEYVCSEDHQQQPFDNSRHVEMYIRNFNSKAEGFRGQFSQADDFTSYSQPSLSQHHDHGTNCCSCYYEEHQHNQLYEHATLCRHNIHQNLVGSSHNVTNQQIDSDNEIVNPLVSHCPNSNDFMEGEGEINEEGDGATTRKSGSVARRNARERKRIKNVNLAFDSLRQRVPQGSKGNKISKVETLRSAIEYIRALQDLVTEKRNKKQRAPEPNSPQTQSSFGMQEYEDEQNLIDSGDIVPV